MLVELNFEWKAHIPIISIEAGERLFAIVRDMIFSADSLVMRCPTLEICTLQARSWTNKEDDLRAFVDACPNLNTLEINRVRGLSVEFLQQLADSARSAFEEMQYDEADSDELAMGRNIFRGNNSSTTRIIPTRLQEINAVKDH